MTSETVSGAELRARLDAVVDEVGPRGTALGVALADVFDEVLTELLAGAATPDPVALVALGSYGRRELCPGSDLDILLVHAAPRRRTAALKPLSEALWYPLWDAGVVTGHATRTVKESIALADEEIDTLTALLQARHVAGEASLTERLESDVRKLAQRRGGRVRSELDAAVARRRLEPGPVAEMLEPDLKLGAGGLRDVQALGWAGSTLGPPGGRAALIERGVLDAGDDGRINRANQRLLDARVALHLVTGGRSDRLLLQDQDAVAEVLGVDDADALVHELSGHAREVAWIARDSFDQLVGDGGRSAVEDRAESERVEVRGARVAVVGDDPPDALTVLEAATTAAEDGIAFERSTLVAFETLAAPSWGVWERAALLRLLRTGHRAIPVFEALDHAGALVVLFPEWAHVRSLPQRNAYHRFTVDRHLLEAVAECAELLDAGDAVADPRTAEIDAVVARACRRPELLLLAALLHDIGKGQPDDHSRVGAAMTGDFVRRIGLDSEGREILDWLVRDHLVMADAATRRDLSDPAVIERFADRCIGDPERLRLLYLLTIGDSRATGPAAWSRTKAALVRDLFVKSAAVIDRRGATQFVDERRDALTRLLGEDAARAHLRRMPESYGMAFDAPDMALHHRLLEAGRQAIEVGRGHDDRPVVTVMTPDVTGVLATLAGALTVAGLSVREAFLFSTEGWALDVFRAVDPFGRSDNGGAVRIVEVVEQALAGDHDLGAAIAERARAYRRDGPRGEVEIRFDHDASEVATVIEIEADDDVGLLYTLAAAFAERHLDVSVAKVQTLGERVIDIFYLSEDGEPVDPQACSRLEVDLRALLAA